MTETKLSFREVGHGTAEWAATVALRDRILRQPLGIQFTPEQLVAEASDYHLVAFDGDKLVACLVLTPGEDGKIKMRQVVVDADCQGKGYGKALVLWSEAFARQHGYRLMHCHARDTAIPFYLRMGYMAKGDAFYEVGILHQYLEKAI